MSSAAVPAKRRRYLIAGAMVVVAVALGAVFGTIVAKAVAGYDVTVVSDPEGSSVTVGDRKLAVWVSPDVGTATCDAVEDGTGRDSFSTTPSMTMTVTDGGRAWVRIGLVDGAPGSTHTLTCSVEPDVQVGYADNPRVVRYVVLGAGLGGTAVLLMLGAFTLALVTALRKPPSA